MPISIEGSCMPTTRPKTDSPVLGLGAVGLIITLGARCSSVVEHPLLVRWVVGSIPHCGLIKLFIVPASAPRLV